MLLETVRLALLSVRRNALRSVLTLQNRPLRL